MFKKLFFQSGMYTYATTQQLNTPNQIKLRKSSILMTVNHFGENNKRHRSIKKTTDK